MVNLDKAMVGAWMASNLQRMKLRNDIEDSRAQDAQRPPMANWKPVVLVLAEQCSIIVKHVVTD